jgi:hypothetical protein
MGRRSQPRLAVGRPRRAEYAPTGGALSPDGVPAPRGEGATGTIGRRCKRREDRRRDRECVMNVCAPDECVPRARRVNLERVRSSFPETRFGRAGVRASRVHSRGVNCPTAAPSDEKNPPAATAGSPGQNGLFALTMMNRAPYHLRAWRDYHVDIIELLAGSWRARSARGRGSVRGAVRRSVRPLRPARAAGEREPTSRWLRTSCE